MRDMLKFYIDGQWVDPIEPKTMDVINPATEEVAGRISIGSAADVDIAVAAAKRAFESYSHRPSGKNAWRCLKRSAMSTSSVTMKSPKRSWKKWAPPGSLRVKSPGSQRHSAHQSRHSRVAGARIREQQPRNTYRQRAYRCLRPDYAVELAAEPDRCESRTGARRGLHDDP